MTAVAETVNQLADELQLASRRGRLRGLTIWRPWPAMFIVRERPGLPPARIENRIWHPSGLGPFVAGVARPVRPLYLALHNSKAQSDRDLICLRGQGYELDPGEPNQILAVCRLSSVLDRHARRESARRLDSEPHCTMWPGARFIWILDQVVPLRTPVACAGDKGRLWDLPPDALTLVRTQWLAARK